jgi:hypothetical protein
MAISYKYYKFLDPQTGKPTKGLGWSYPKTRRSVHIKLPENSNPIIVKDSAKEGTFSYTPMGKNIQEISLEEYNALDLKDESLSGKLLRERLDYYKETKVDKDSVVKTTPVVEIINKAFKAKK